MVALPPHADLCLHVCGSSAALLQWPEEENHQSGGLCQVVQQTVLPGGYWDMHGEWQMWTHTMFNYSNAGLEKQANVTLSTREFPHYAKIWGVWKISNKGTLTLKFNKIFPVFMHSLHSVVLLSGDFFLKTYNWNNRHSIQSTWMSIWKNKWIFIFSILIPYSAYSSCFSYFK